MKAVCLLGSMYSLYTCEMILYLDFEKEALLLTSLRLRESRAIGIFNITPRYVKYNAKVNSLTYIR